MADYFKPTGNNGSMMIRTTNDIVEFFLRGDSNTKLEAVPWAYTLNGKTEWRSLTLDNLASYVKIHLMQVTYSQTVIFSLGDTNTYDMGGPTEFSVYVSRGDSGRGVDIRVGTTLRKAIPYINVNGVWKVSEPWAKAAGVWKQTG